MLFSFHLVHNPQLYSLCTSFACHLVRHLQFNAYTKCTSSGTPSSNHGSYLSHFIWYTLTNSLAIPFTLHQILIHNSADTSCFFLEHYSHIFWDIISTSPNIPLSGFITYYSHCYLSYHQNSVNVFHLSSWRRNHSPWLDQLLHTSSPRILTTLAIE